MAEAKHEDLSGVFARKPAPRDRAASLAGLLPPRTKAGPGQDEIHAVERQPEPAAEAAPTVTTPQTRTAARGSAPVGAAGESPDAIVNLPVYLPEDIRTWLQSLPRGRTYADVLLEAFESVGPERLSAYFTPRPRTAPSGMPLAPEVSSPGSGPQRQFRVRRAQLRWIEDLAVQVGAPNRSVLCVAVLRMHLEDREGSQHA